MLNLSGIVTDSIVDGPGLRVSIFAQGCPHRCPGCHNPETWDFGVGTDIAPEQVYDIVKSNPLCKGVTFSGGEPFAQAEEFSKLADLLKADGYEVASYTGFTFEQLMQGTPAQKTLLAKLDVLIDGRFIQAEKSLELSFRGSRNQRIIDVQKSLAENKAVLHTAMRWNGE